MPTKRYTRRDMVGRMLAGAAAISYLDNEVHAANANFAAIDPKDHIKITKLETFPISRTRREFYREGEKCAGLEFPGTLGCL